MAERARSENLEAENNPEQTVSNAVAVVENRDATDPVISSTWGKNAQEFFSKAWEKSEKPRAVMGVGTLIVAKIVKGLLKFTYEAIKNKGKVPKAYEIGKEMFDYGAKKEK